MLMLRWGRGRRGSAHAQIGLQHPSITFCESEFQAVRTNVEEIHQGNTPCKCGYKADILKFSLLNLMWCNSSTYDNDYESGKLAGAANMLTIAFVAF